MSFPSLGFLDDYMNSDLKTLREWNVLMQYTGLKDKNGVEIYEGDLIIGVYGRVVDNPHWKANGVGLVEWMPFDKCAGFQTKNPHIDIFDEKTVEVIGNIHENPELFKEDL